MVMNKQLFFSRNKWVNKIKVSKVPIFYNFIAIMKNEKCDDLKCNLLT